MSPNTIIPIITLAFCSGILLIGTILYLYVYAYSRLPLYLSVAVIGLLGLFSIVSEMMLIMLGLLDMGLLGMQFHRIQALTITLYLFALPYMFHNLLELNHRLKRFNKAVYTAGGIIAAIIIVCAFAAPGLFLSFSKKATTIITPWNLGRATPGILYRVRDALIMLVALYSIMLMILELILSKRYEHIRLLLIGLAIGIATGVIDLLLAWSEMETGLYSLRVFSVYNIGLTIFTILSMISIMKLFIDQTGELEKARRNEYLELLAGGVAHDFNNILTGILGNVSLAMAHTTKEDPNHSLLEEIEKASERARNLTRQLLTFSRGGILSKNIISLQSLIEEIVNFSLHGSNIKAVYRISPALWNADVDVDQISQLIQNLTINAKQAMPHGGQLEIRAGNYPVKRTTPVLPAGNYLKIVFSDSGKGIPGKHISSIFEPYFSTKKTGAGLGLATSLTIIKKHHGHIEVSSKINEGSAFTIYLPATDRPVTGRSETQPLPGNISGRALLMDDEDLVLNVGSRILRHIGFTTVCVKRGEDAIDEFRRSAESRTPFDIIILDLTIKGGMGGKETAETVKKLDPKARIIVSTGYSQDLAISDYKKFGFDGAVVKPYTIEDMQRVIESVMDELN